MGLLSDAVKRRKFILFLERWNRSLSLLGYVCGIVWLFMLASKKFNNSVYISENALLPAAVETSYSEDYVAMEHYEKLKQLCTQNVQTQRLWVSQQLRSAGLEVFHQNFSCQNKAIQGENIYGILRSPRSSGVESVVLNLPQRYGCNSNGGLALMISVLHHFKFQNYWAKDIIFLVSEEDSCGVGAWLQSYHGVNMKGIESNDLQMHAGKIQAALVVDFPQKSVHGLDVHFESVNGLLPNLDLINMAFRVASVEQVPMKLHTEDSYFGFVDDIQDYARHLRALFKMIMWQATGFPSGVHGHYVKYRIEAITLKNSVTGERHYEAHFNHIGKLVEGIFRSFNNLQEHFHQSFFMYLLPASDRYISIALYMPVLGGILIGPLFHAISLWMQTYGKDIENEAANDKKVSSDSFWHAVVFISLPHLIGTLLYLILPYMVEYGDGNAGQQITTELVVGSWTVALSFGFIQPAKSHELLKTLKLVIVVYITAVVSMTSLLNFSLALLIAVPLVPMILCVDVDHNSRRFALLAKYMITVLMSPVVCVILLSALHILVYDATNFDARNIDARTLLDQSIAKTQSLIRYAIIDQHHDVWTWKLLCLVVFPIWILTTGLAHPS